MTLVSPHQPSGTNRTAGTAATGGVSAARSTSGTLPHNVSDVTADSRSEYFV
jgi:hypothetical protein